MISKHIVHWKKRPLIYSLILTFGFLVLFSTLNSLGRKYFLSFGVLVYFIILLELFLTSNHFHVFHKKNSEKTYEFENHKLIQYSHHLLLPTLLYFGILLFGYFNEQFSTYFLLLILAFVLFAVLFENIHSYYKHEFSLHKSTNYIYDLISVILVYLWADIFINTSNLLGLKNGFLIILLSMNFFVFGGLLVLRHAFIRYFVFFLIGLTLVLGMINYILIYHSVSILVVVLINTIFFHTFSFYLTHYIDKSLNRSTVSEYIMVLMLFFSLLYLYGI